MRALAGALNAAFAVLLVLLGTQSQSHERDWVMSRVPGLLTPTLSSTRRGRAEPWGMTKRQSPMTNQAPMAECQSETICPDIGVHQWFTRRVLGSRGTGVRVSRGLEHDYPRKQGTVPRSACVGRAQGTVGTSSAVQSPFSR